MILIRNIERELINLYMDDELIDIECTGINITCDIGRLKNCKIYIKGVDIIDETILRDKVKQAVYEEILDI